MLRLAPIVATLILMICPATASAAADPDPWFGKDKMLHFGVSAGLAAGGYAAGTVFWEGTEERLLAGAALALGLGVAKELYDLTGRGHPSWRDLAWDVAGTAVGLGLAWSVDRLLGGPSDGSRASSRGEEGLAIGAGGLAFRW